jgi:glycosyltransferase involved in cell wall biosynthesis
LRITLINQYYAPDLSPTARLAVSLAEHRAAMGDEVMVVTSAARYAGNGNPVRRPPRNQRGNPSVWRAPAPRRAAESLFSRALHYASFYLTAGVRLARLPRQDVIICMTTPPFAVVLALLHRWLRGRAKLMLWTMDCYPEILEAAGLIRRGGLLARLGRRLNRWVFRRLAHVICLDEAMRQLVQSSYVHNGSPAVTVIPNWEPYARYALSDAPPPWAGRERLGLRDRFVVLYLGNAGYGHEFETVLDAAEALRDEPVGFLFVGGGSRYARLRDASARRQLDNVRFHPYVPHEELPSVLASADLSLVTLSDEALGLMSPSKFHSYLAMSVPVIYVGPRGSNVDWAVERFGCGFAVRHGQAEQMVEFIRRARRDRPWLLELKRKARRAFEAAYCDRRTLPQFDRLLETLGS